MKPSFLCFWIFALSLSFAQAQHPSKRGRGVPEVESLSQDAVSATLYHFRNQRLNGDYVFDFELKHMPRRGKSTIYKGRMWGTWSDQGPRTRVKLHGESDGKIIRREWLFHSGHKPQVWKVEDQQHIKLQTFELFLPLLPELTLTPYDLMLGFIYWEHADYVESTRIRNHPAHVFDFYPPRDGLYPLQRARVTLHAAYKAIMDVQVFDAKDAALKRFHIRSFKKVDDQWIVKSIDYLDERTHHKTRFQIVRAALRLELPYAYFSKAWSKGSPAIPTGRLQNVR